MRFANDYNNPMDRVSSNVNYVSPDGYDSFDSEPFLPPNEIGQTVTEGQGAGTLLDSLQASIKMGASRVELALQEQGSQPRVGAEHYGKEVREDIRNIADINKVRIHSVHAPVSVGNISGLGRNGFSEEQRENELNEIKRAINFASDVAPKEGGVSVVVHTGEFPRNIDDVNSYEGGSEKWGFEQYPGSSNNKTFYLVDKFTGEILTQIKKDQPVDVPEWNTSDEDKDGFDDVGNPVHIKKGDYVDFLGRKVTKSVNLVPKIDDNNNIKTVSMNWGKIIDESTKYKRTFKDELLSNKIHPEDFRPELYVFWTNLQSKEKSAEGWAEYHSQGLKDDIDKLKDIDLVLNHYKEQGYSKEFVKEYLSHYFPQDQLNILPNKKKDVIQYLNQLRQDTEKSIRYKTEASLGYKMEAEQVKRMKMRVAPVDVIAKEKTFNSLAELGTYAYIESKDKKLDKPIFIAPENIFPEMGYGSHPDELIEMVKKSREKMVDLLTNPKVKVTKLADNGRLEEIEQDNHFYNSSLSKKEAAKIAHDSIKATFDTQHLGMWFRYFKSDKAKTEAERIKEFNNWYLEQVKKLEKEDVIGNIHMVDGFGRSHTHLPVGQGELPVKSAIEYLKKKGYSGNLSSEGHEEGSIRQLVKAWQHFDSPIYGMGTGRVKTWTDVHNSYFDKITPPSNYVAGPYVPSQEEWKLWSEVPLE